MQRGELSFFDEKRATVQCETEWGCWWQTVQEVHIKVNIPENTCAKQIQVDVQPKHIKCVVSGKTIFEGDLPRTIYTDDLIWTIENGKDLCIVLTKSDYSFKDDMWESLLSNGQYQPDQWTLHEMRKNLDLERFQIQNPGMDFSGAKLAKNYDRLPGWSNDRLADLKAKSALKEEDGKEEEPNEKS